MPDLNHSYRILRKPFGVTLMPIPSRPLQQRDGKVARTISRNAEMRASHFWFANLAQGKKGKMAQRMSIPGLEIGPVGGVLAQLRCEVQ
jgi:hypothetical protein